MGQWIDFKKLRAQLDNAQVLADYGVVLVGEGAQRRAKCPLPQHDKDDGRQKPFSIKLSHGIWRCFSCGQQGNMIDFTALMEGLDPEAAADIRKAALMLQKKYAPGNVPAGKSTGPGKRKSPPPKSAKPTPKDDCVVNAPMDFQLKNLDTRADFLLKRGYVEPTIEHFGLGYCSKGMFAGRIAIPLHNMDGQLIGYAGRMVYEDSIDENNPKYLVPGRREHNGVIHQFDASRFLYHGYRISAPVDKLIVVEHYPCVWRLWQAGYVNAVATMASGCSAMQGEQIVRLTKPEGSVWVVSFDEGNHTRFAAEVMGRVSPHRFVRWAKLDQHPLAALSLQELADLLWHV